MKKVERLLVLSPHTHDGNFSAGGTIAKFIEEGTQVFYIAFCPTENFVKESGKDSDLIRNESITAAGELGIPLENVVLLDFPFRLFPRYRQEILDTMITFSREIKPNLVFCPSSYDTNQDQQVIYEETVRAFKKTSSIWGMDQPWSNMSSRTDIFVELTEEQLAKKVKAIMECKSQSYKDNFSEDYIKAAVFTRGMTIGVKYAEAFECVRLLI
jgi:LmbE family N-acetylglucosaminyl deacetylase